MTSIDKNTVNTTPDNIDPIEAMLEELDADIKSEENELGIITDDDFEDVV